jgi:hypothetical protein
VNKCYLYQATFLFFELVSGYYFFGSNFYETIGFFMEPVCATIGFLWNLMRLQDCYCFYVSMKIMDI